MAPARKDRDVFKARPQGIWFKPRKISVKFGYQAAADPRWTAASPAGWLPFGWLRAVGYGFYSLGRGKEAQNSSKGVGALRYDPSIGKGYTDDVNGHFESSGGFAQAVKTARQPALFALSRRVRQQCCSYTCPVVFLLP